MNLCCPGKLDDSTNTCVVCNTTFCEFCECPKHANANANHVCVQENIDSVEFVKTLIRCPNLNCRLPVIRSWGCNFITCSVCKTNFDYTTGHKTTDGNHQHVSTVLNTTIKASERFGHDNNIQTQLLVDIDRLVPNTPSLARIISVLSSVYNKATEQTALNKSSNNLQIAKEYEVYTQNQHAYKTYYRALVTIGDHHDKKTLTTNVLTMILEKLQETQQE